MITSKQAILEEMTRRLVAELQPSQVILFGSHAWGQPNEDSDVDLFVIVPDSKKVTTPHTIFPPLVTVLPLCP